MNKNTLKNMDQRIEKFWTARRISVASLTLACLLGLLLLLLEISYNKPELTVAGYVFWFVSLSFVWFFPSLFVFMGIRSIPWFRRRPRRFLFLTVLVLVTYVGYKYAPIAEFKPYCENPNQQFSSKLNQEFQDRFEYALQQLGGTDTFEWGGWYRNSDDRYYFSYTDIQGDVVLNAFNQAIASTADPNALIGAKIAPGADAPTGVKLYWAYSHDKANHNSNAKEKKWCDLVQFTTQVSE